MDNKGFDIKELLVMCVTALGALWIVCSSMVQCDNSMARRNSAYDQGRLEGLKEKQ